MAFRRRCSGHAPARTSPLTTLQLGVMPYCCQWVLLLLSGQHQQQQLQEQQQGATST